ncbi:bactofilin family protein [Sphingomonas sp. ERG5]|uniref:bactofilin family protein n=1 Tax=Sphingomonas sp. ERG5 TaxID=1381597 RepID=UPI00054BDAAA|nr:polymer-forming cytoskeletal protein [Sphingomonas sp. ERG5]
MFNSGNRGRDNSNSALPSAAQSQAPGGKRGMFSVIGADVVITGNIAATADLHIEGRVVGDVDCGGLVQGTESRITGLVKAETARLAGTIDGAVSVRQLTVERAARITGDVEYETISIENGASIDGRLKHVNIDAGLRATPSAPILISAPSTEELFVSSTDAAAA